MPPSISSTSIATQKDLDALPIINYQLVDFDTGHYRRRVEQFEYCWGMEKGQLDLCTTLNYVQLRSDMADRMDQNDWALLPTKSILSALNALSDHNKSAEVHKRKRFTEFLPEQEYEYEFLPIRIGKRDRPSVYLKRGSSTRTINKAYSKVPRIRSRAHPLFVIYCTWNQLLASSTWLPDAKASRLVGTVGDTVHRWRMAPPIEFLVGPDVWAEHRHPSSDDGSMARARLATCKSPREKKTTRAARGSTRSPSLQSEARQHRPSIYDRARQGTVLPKSPVLPRSTRASEAGSSDSNPDVNFSPTDLREWLDSITPKPRQKMKVKPPPSSTGDAILTRYRKEPARDPANALRGTLLVTHAEFVDARDGLQRSVYCSNDWAWHVYHKCLWSSNPPQKARFGHVDLRDP
ncbi:hypothetical protein EV122DRAFT_283818 [Schizophyllum commune]